VYNYFYTSKTRIFKPKYMYCFYLYQGIVHLVIGSLGADPITTGDYYGIKLEHVNTNESFWLNSKLTMGEVRGKHEALYPADEWK